MSTVALVGQDPRFRGGALAQMEAFHHGAAGLGYDVSFHYVANPALAGVALGGSPLDVPGAATPLARVEPVRQLLGARALAPRVRAADTVWVVAATASHGYAAVRAGRPYACWIGTTLADEWRGRPGVSWSRRLARAANAPVLRRLEAVVLRRAARLYATSPASRASVARAAGVAEADVRILPLPVDVERFAPLPDEQWVAGLERPVLVFVGRADDPRKNVDLLLRALPAIRAAVPGARARLVGAPPARLPDGADATGVVADVAPHLRDAALFVLPSLQEGFGIVAAEALAAGVPVLATPSGGPEELLRSSGGGVVLPGFGAAGLAAAAVELLRDPATLVAMRSRGREHVVREHGPERFRSLLAEALRELA